MPPSGIPCGLGHIRRGHVGPVGRTPAVLVTEMLLPRPLDTVQRKRVHSALRSTLVPRDDLAAPLGVVPARLECGGAGIWVAWSDATGAAEACSPAWMPAWMQQSKTPATVHVQTPSTSAVACPLHKALQANPTNPARSPEWRLTVARQLAAAVAGLHRAGRCHGSLSPNSIWAAPDGSVSIIESGLVDLLLEFGVLFEHELLAYLGVDVARYLAPEGWEVPRRTGPKAGAASDVYALGLILLEIFEGACSPHAECKTLQHLSAKVLPKRGQQVGQRLSHSGAYGQLPGIARRTIEACLNVSPDSRPEAEKVLFSLAAPTDQSGSRDVRQSCKGETPLPQQDMEEAVAEAEDRAQAIFDEHFNLREKIASMKVFGQGNRCSRSSTRTTSADGASAEISTFSSATSSSSRDAGPSSRSRGFLFWCAV